MSENTLGKLVKKAKGDDRTLREYARESGVDAAVISKIINGYVPKKPEIFMALTSADAAPRGGVTYEQLIKAANSSKSYQAGVDAGMAIAEATLALVGGVSVAALGGLPIASAAVGAGAVSALSKSLSSTKKKGEKGVDEIINEVQRFAAMAKGIIFSGLGAKGIQFQIENERNTELQGQYDMFLKLTDQPVSEYIVIPAYIPKEQRKIQYFVESTPRRIVEELIFLNPAPDRKVSLITNMQEVYDYLLSYKDKMSYNGDLSIILVDTKNAELLKEEYISHHSANGTDKEMFIV